MGGQAIALLSICRGWPALRRLRATTTAIDELEWRDLRLLRVGLLAFASVANEAEAWLLGLLRRETVAFTVLPDIALVASHAVAAVVKVFTVHATDRAVESPLAFLFFEFLELFPVLLFLREALSLGDALSLCGCITFRALRDSTLRIVFQLGQFLLVEDAFGVTLSHSLLSGKSARFVTLLAVS